MLKLALMLNNSYDDLMASLLVATMFLTLTLKLELDRNPSFHPGG